MSQWWVTNSNPTGLAAAPVIGGGGNPQAIPWRSTMDQARAGSSPHPNDYPDGYLGSITGRRQDRIFQKVQQRLTDRSYQRGVHVGSKMGTDAYFWGDDFNPESRLEAEAGATRSTATGAVKYKVERQRPIGSPVEHLAHMGKTSGIMSPEQQSAARQYGVPPAYTADLDVNPERTKRMSHLLPSYR